MSLVFLPRFSHSIQLSILFVFIFCFFSGHLGRARMETGHHSELLVCLQHCAKYWSVPILRKQPQLAGKKKLRILRMTAF